MSEIDIHELGAAYALDALDSAERQAYEAHFATCVSCRREVAEYRETAGSLAALTEATPPADLRARVLAEVATTRQLAPRPAPVVELRRRLPRVLAAAAALVAVVVAGVLVVGRGGEASFNDQVAAMMDDPDSQMAHLDGPAGGFKLVWDDVHVAVLGDRLPAPAPGMRYELWLVDSAGPHPMGLLDPADGGAVRRMLDVPDDMPDDMTVTAWGVTVEPAEGSPSPSEPVRYQAAVPAA